MNLSEFMESVGVVPGTAAAQLATAAWDAALCAAAAQAMDRGTVRPGFEIMAEISRLHSWNETQDFKTQDAREEGGARS